MMIRFIFIILVAISCFSCQPNGQSGISEKQVNIEDARFVMFPTENMWTFLKLDSQNGKIWQVQYSVDENDFRGEIELNNKSLVSGDKTQNGRFTLYPTKNMFNFILLDQVDGRMWQVQWSTKEDGRLIIPM